MPIQDTSDFGIQQAQLTRRQQMADMLRKQSMEQSSGDMVSGHYIAPSWSQGLNKMAQALVGNKMQGEVDSGQKALADAVRGRDAGDLENFMAASRTRPEITLPEGEVGPVSPAQGPDKNEQLRIALASQNPMLQGIGQAMAKQQFVPENVVVGRSLLNKNDGTQVGMDSTWADEQKNAREQRIAEAQRAQEAKIAEAQRSEAARIEAQRQRDQDRADQAAQLRTLAGAGGGAVHPITVLDEATGKTVIKDAKSGRVLGVAPSNTGNKPLPATALKMQQEAVDMVGTSASINSDLAGFQKQIDDGKLDFGLGSNLINGARNYVGASNEQSKNFASFKSNMERLRNESLRLNKGVQTDGDAQRAWNELFQNINDKDVVRQRLAEIQEINKRGIALQKLNVDNIRSNYGHDPYSFEGVDVQPSPYNKGASGGWGDSGGGAPAQDAIAAEIARRAASKPRGGGMR